MKFLTRAIWLLSLVSFFTDIASEMLYPVMPVYLKEIGFSILLIGILEGVAEATAGLSKSYFGKLSDAANARVPFVRLGYAMSAISKPLMALLVTPIWIFTARALDRLGKGIRTGARDAMLSDQATQATKGRVFGFHRGWDTLGAVAGPSFALLYLYFHPGNYKALFLVAFLPGVVSIGLTFFLKERSQPGKIQLGAASLFSFAGYWKESPGPYKKLLAGLILFAIINSSDVFLLLKLKDAGLSDTFLIGVYIFYNLVYALFAYPLGSMSDRVGFKSTFLLGLALFGIVYAGMAFGSGLYVFLALFLVYGIYAAATESIAKAWISNICPRNETATAIGTYTGFQSIATMIASSLAGWIWLNFGAMATFLFPAAGAVIIILYILFFVQESGKQLPP